MMERWYVVATFRDDKNAKIATAYLSYDLFALPLLVASPNDHAWSSRSQSEAMAMRNKMSVDRYTYYDPISGKTYKVTWDIKVKYEVSR